MPYSILTVDGTGVVEREMFSLFKNHGVHITNVSGIGEALDAIKRDSSFPGVIIWALNSGKEKDFIELSRLKQASASPIIVISGLTDKRYIVRAVETGVTDYIVKPYNEKSLLDKVTALLGIPVDKDEWAIYSEDFAVFNFSEMLDREIKAASRGGHSLGILKIVFAPKENFLGRRDCLDAVISLASRIIKARLRITDTAFRHNSGGIFVLLPFTEKSGQEIAIEKIRGILSNHALMKEKFQRYDLSITGAVYPEDGKVRRKLMEKLKTVEPDQTAKDA